MPGFVPIQQNAMAHGLTEPLASLAVSGGFAGAFAALLSSVLQSGHETETRSPVEVEPAPLAEPVQVGNDKGVHATSPEPVTVPPPAKIPDPLRPVASGQISDDAEKTPEAVDILNGPDTSPSGIIPDQKAPAGAARISNSVGKAPDKGRKAPDKRDRTHIRTVNETPPKAAPLVGQITPTVTSSVAQTMPEVVPAAFKPVVVPDVETPVAASPPVPRGANPKEPDPPRTAPPRSSHPERPDASSKVDVVPEKSATVSETMPLPTPPNVSHSASPVLDPAAVRTTPQNQATADPVSPAHQITPALISVLKTTDGTQSITIHLQPRELGQVQIRVDQTTEGPAHVDITAERPETLALLKRDEPALQQMLDQAGVLSNGRSVSFQVATPDQIVTMAPRADGMTAGSDSSRQDQNGGAWRQSEDGQRDPGNPAGSEQQRARARWFRTGLDITA